MQFLKHGSKNRLLFKPIPKQKTNNYKFRRLFVSTVISYRLHPVTADPLIRARIVKIRVRVRILVYILLMTKFEISTPLIFQD